MEKEKLEDISLEELIDMNLKINLLIRKINMIEEGK